jgi:hypothetical protein
MPAMMTVVVAMMRCLVTAVRGTALGNRSHDRRGGQGNGEQSQKSNAELHVEILKLGKFASARNFGRRNFSAISKLRQEILPMKSGLPIFTPQLRRIAYAIEQ